MHRLHSCDSITCARPVDKEKGTFTDYSAFPPRLDIFPFVVGHESERRKWKRLWSTESGVQQQWSRAKQASAGTVDVGGQWPGHPRL